MLFSLYPVVITQDLAPEVTHPREEEKVHHQREDRAPEGALEGKVH